MFGKGLHQTSRSCSSQVRRFSLRNPESVTRTVGYQPGATACRMQTRPWGQSSFLSGCRAGLDARMSIRGGCGVPRPPSSVGAWPSWPREGSERPWEPSAGLSARRKAGSHAAPQLSGVALAVGAVGLCRLALEAWKGGWKTETAERRKLA